MDYEWDPRKAAENQRKHGVDFADAVIALEDENAITIEDADHKELRFKTLGMDATARSCSLCIASAPRIESVSFRHAKPTSVKPDNIFRA